MPNYENAGAKSLIDKKFDKPYKIKPKQFANAKKLGVIIKPSENHLKKIDVFKVIGKGSTSYNEKLASIGGRYQDGKWYGDYASYLLDPEDRYGNEVDPEERRKLYLARHKHESKSKKNKKNKVKETPSYFADKILWT